MLESLVWVTLTPDTEGVAWLRGRPQQRGVFVSPPSCGDFVSGPA
jgi:hypothetical protein